MKCVFPPEAEKAPGLNGDESQPSFGFLGVRGLATIPLWAILEHRQDLAKTAHPEHAQHQQSAPLQRCSPAVPLHWHVLGYLAFRLVHPVFILISVSFCFCFTTLVSSHFQCTTAVPLRLVSFAYQQFCSESRRSPRFLDVT